MSLPSCPSAPPLPPDLQVLIERARQYALDLERHARLESSQGQLSPTDLALFSRVVTFLRFDIASVTTGDPSILMDDDR